MPTSPQPKIHPRLLLRTLDRGDGLLGLRPCGPVRPPARTPLFGARGPQVTVAMLQWTPAAPAPQALATAHARLGAAGLHPLPADALQWRGDVSPLDGTPLWSLVREGDFADFWAEVLPALEAEGRRILVFSQFTRMLLLVQAELDALGLPWLSLTGDTPTAQRGDTVARFQRGEAPLFLVSLKAGGVGLNLTAADTVIHVDPWWNPAVEQQASAARTASARPSR